MSQGLSKGEKPSWNTPSGRAGNSAMDRVSDSARARRVKALSPKKGSNAMRRAPAKAKPTR